MAQQSRFQNMWAGDEKPIVALGDTSKLFFF